jgi:hypothetical protein
VLYFHIESQSATVNLTTTLPASDRWYHVAGTLDDATGNMKLYVNGVLAASSNTSIRPFALLDSNYDPRVLIGGPQGFHGSMDEIRVTNTALRPDQFLNATPVPEPRPILLAFAGLTLLCCYKINVRRHLISFRKFSGLTRLFVLIMASYLGQSTYGYVDIVYGTGQLNDGSSAARSSVDLHYQIIATKDYYTSQPIPNIGPNAYVSRPDVRYISPSDSAQWISTSPNLVSVPIGWYTFRTTFNLSGYDPSNFQINGYWAMDNSTRGPGMLLNGIDTGNNLDESTGGEKFLALYPFSITNGFRSGINTLDFVVMNWGAPTALLVSMSIPISTVPETSSMVMAGISILILFVAGLIRRKKRAIHPIL